MIFTGFSLGWIVTWLPRCSPQIYCQYIIFSAHEGEIWAESLSQRLDSWGFSHERINTRVIECSFILNRFKEWGWFSWRSFPHWFHNKLLRWFPKISVPWYSYFVWSFPTLCQDWSVSNTEMICPSKARSQKTMHLYIKCSGRKLLLHHKDTQPCGESYMVKKKKMKIPCQQPAITCQTCEWPILEVDCSAVKTQMTVAAIDILTRTSREILSQNYTAKLFRIPDL